MAHLKNRFLNKIKKNNDLNSILYLVKWIVLAGLVGSISGLASAFFLMSLAWVTEAQMTLPALLFLLPFGGVLVSYLYLRFGKLAIKGNNLIIAQAKGASNEHVPFLMAPLVLFGTLVTHLFGGSAGREGTAVQMGGSIAESIGRMFELHVNDRQILLICGMSSGFGAVFGTPFAGALFGIEVLGFGKFRYQAIVPSVIATFIGHGVVNLCGVEHSQYDIGRLPELTVLLCAKVGLSAILFGLASILFVQLTQFFKKSFAWINNPMLRSFIGGCLIIILTFVLGTRAYNGLSLPLLSQAFDAHAAPESFLLKTLFTSLTLGSGFQGGEVTPLFVIGATLGSTLAGIFNVSVPLLAACGFIAVFAGAAKTPIVCFIMGIELFGGGASIYLFIACIVSFYISGKSSIYTSQRLSSGT